MGRNVLLWLPHFLFLRSTRYSLTDLGFCSSYIPWLDSNICAIYHWEFIPMRHIWDHLWFSLGILCSLFRKDQAKLLDLPWAFFHCNSNLWVILLLPNLECHLFATQTRCILLYHLLGLDWNQRICSKIQLIRCKRFDIQIWLSHKELTYLGQISMSLQKCWTYLHICLVLLPLQIWYDIGKSSWLSCTLCYPLSNKWRLLFLLCLDVWHTLTFHSSCLFFYSAYHTGWFCHCRILGRPYLFCSGHRLRSFDCIVPSTDVGTSALYHNLMMNFSWVQTRSSLQEWHHHCMQD